MGFFSLNIQKLPQKGQKQRKSNKFLPYFFSINLEFLQKSSTF